MITTLTIKMEKGNSGNVILSELRGNFSLSIIYNISWSTVRRWYQDIKRKSFGRISQSEFESINAFTFFFSCFVEYRNNATRIS